MFWPSVSKSLLAVCVVLEFAVIVVESFTCENSTCANGFCQSFGACETSKSCFSQTQELKMPEMSRNLNVQQKGCSLDECTGLAFSATLGDQRTFKYEQRCCTTAECNKMDIQPSQVPAKANGVQCLACYMEAGMLCIPTLLKCTGNETKCVSVIGTAAGSNSLLSVVMVGEGCATESACNLDMTVLDLVNIRTFCSSGIPVPSTTSSVPVSTGLRPTSISTVPVLISLLLLNVLF
ncbi:protein RoBo-1-like [Mastomys coucha]|uniref:protein RoBo-1-like n=1 Tax=Mastomys coucha TaxID=35658 RepID=UPI001261DD11|nr:protein RoBo-1-like [Mastomys coucha]